jgi:hypothetical protein
MLLFGYAFCITNVGNHPKNEKKPKHCYKRAKQRHTHVTQGFLMWNNPPMRRVKTTGLSQQKFTILHYAVGFQRSDQP